MPDWLRHPSRKQEEVEYIYCNTYSSKNQPQPQPDRAQHDSYKYIAYGSSPASHPQMTKIEHTQGGRKVSATPKRRLLTCWLQCTRCERCLVRAYDCIVSDRRGKWLVYICQSECRVATTGHHIHTPTA